MFASPNDLHRDESTKAAVEHAIRTQLLQLYGNMGSEASHRVVYMESAPEPAEARLCLFKVASP